jgi:mannosyltransferase OCH1-like enzyme
VNETNFAKRSPSLVDYAHRAHNWAFAADIIRVIVLYEYGGIYVDSDYEFFANLDQMLKYDCFMCYESKFWVENAILGSKAGHPVFEKLVHRYDQEHGITFYTAIHFRCMPSALSFGFL